jgi:hypothetical protein
MMIEQGTAVEPKTGRKFFLDCRYDLKRNEKVTFILSSHGARSYRNWQRHYFPILDYKDKYRLVIATPTTPTRVWTPDDDTYLQNIVNLVYEQVGQKNIKAFWLSGHSQGGMTSNRLLRTELFAGRVDSWLSLSGGRLGPTPLIPASFFAAARPGGAGAASLPCPGTAGLAAAMAALREPPPASFSFFETGEHEFGDQPIPEDYPWEAKFGCGARVRRPDVVDTNAGYVYDPTRQDPGSEAWDAYRDPVRSRSSNMHTLRMAASWVMSSAWAKYTPRDWTPIHQAACAVDTVCEEVSEVRIGEPAKGSVRIQFRRPQRRFG